MQIFFVMTWSLIILLFFKCNKNILKNLGITTKNAIRNRKYNKKTTFIFYRFRFYRLIRFEDLALHPVDSTLKIFQYLNLPTTSNSKLYIQKHTKATNTKNLVSRLQFPPLLSFSKLIFYSTLQPLWEIQDKLFSDGQQKWRLTREKQLRILVKQLCIYGGKYARFRYF